MKDELVQFADEALERAYNEGADPDGDQDPIIFGPRRTAAEWASIGQGILSLQSQLAAAQDKLARAEGALERMADTGDHGEAALNGKSCRALARTALEALREPAVEEGRG